MNFFRILTVKTISFTAITSALQKIHFKFFDAILPMRFGPAFTGLCFFVLALSVLHFKGQVTFYSLYIFADFYFTLLSNRCSIVMVKY